MAGALKKRMLALQQRLTDTFGTDISTPEARRSAWWHFQLMDHAFLRTIWTNLDEIAPGVWRANQPSPARLRTYQRKLGLKSVLNLRGAAQQGFYLFEAETCRALGLTLHDIGFSARSAPKRHNLLHLLDLFQTIEKPFLMHCKSGADRTGLAAALYLLEVEKRPLAEARRQLSLNYLHLKMTDTGIMDEFLNQFEAEGHGRSLRAWIETGYDRDRLTASFKARRGRPA
ncbi:protein tyrosine phosphatase [bacterium]|nr:protein tyrosine phosphatase [bacterium]